MNGLKRAFKSRGSKVWLIVTSFLAVFFIVANILLSGWLNSLVCIVLGSKRAVYADGVEAIYPTTTSDKAMAKEFGEKKTQEIASEGIVLLKNKDAALPLAKGAKISVFGKNSVNLVYGGSGSGGGDSSNYATLYEGLEEADFELNPELEKFYKNDKRSGDPRDANPKIENDGNSKIVATETSIDKYDETVIGSYKNYNDAALIVISRIGGEGFDLPRKSIDDENRHYLELIQNEKDLIQHVCENFEKVILIVNSANAMELGFVEDGTYGEIDACLSFPGPGSTGALALGEVLKEGGVNPSGRTSDTFVSDLTKDPTWNNFGDNNKTNGDKYSNIDAYFVDYEEGVYVGYRYYETRAAEYDGAINGEAEYANGEEWYQNAVVYSFGEGLSYTTFTWEIDGSALANKTISDNTGYDIKVKVTNTGDVAGKDVVQLYATAPYTDGEIEKAHKVLCGFVKTDLLKKGETKEYTITFTPYDIASYDYEDQNGNGFAGYELDGGAYTLHVAKNAHDTVATVNFSVAEGGIRYEKDPTTNNTVDNKYEGSQYGSDDHLSVKLSRSDWASTWPTAPTEADRVMDDATIAAVTDTSHNNPNASSYTKMPLHSQTYKKLNEETGEEEDAPITLRDMNGVAYGDKEKWDAFLAQLTPDDMVRIYNEGAFQTLEVEKNGQIIIPYTKESDGPVGFCNFMSDSNIYGTNGYTCEVMLAQTWNVELAYDMGYCIGEEGKWGDIEGRVSGAPYSGLYAPGANIHRSAFGGRNFEYFSEDSFLTGMMAAYEIKGAQKNGTFMTMKHFALNEQETHRSTGYASISWVTEQTMREIYLKPFEMAVKIADTHAVMSSFNRIGSRWTGGDYRLLTEILREEWGFEGLVICDFNTNSYMNTKQEIYAGGDLNLSTTRSWNSFNSSSSADVTVAYNAMHNIMYVLANSNAINGEIVGYKLPVWQICLYVADVVLAVGLAVWGVFAIRNSLKIAENSKGKKSKSKSKHKK